MRVSIALRLFLAVLLAMLAVAAFALMLIRQQVVGGFSEYATNQEIARVEALSRDLAQAYQQHQGWSFLPADTAERKAWLGTQMQRVPAANSETAAPATESGSADMLAAGDGSTSLARRLGLLDQDENYLAGVVPATLTKAIASLDTVRRPVVLKQKTIGYLLMVKASNPDDALAVAFLVGQQQQLVTVAIASVLLSAFAATVLALHFRRPIQQLVTAARQLSRARYDTRVPIDRVDELGELARTFNELAEKLGQSEKERQQWVSDTSHELRTPVSVLRAQIEAIQDGVRPADKDNIALMMRQVTALSVLVEDLHALASTDAGKVSYHFVRQDMAPLLRSICESFAEKFQAAGLHMELAGLTEQVFVLVDAERMTQVLNNVLENTVRYTDAGGRLRVNATVDQSTLQIVLDDTAPAVPEADLPRLSERFFRVESSRNRQYGGRGLGLALSRQIMMAHDGQLLLSPSPLGGLRVTLQLPLARRHD